MFDSSKQVQVCKSELCAKNKYDNFIAAFVLGHVWLLRVQNVSAEYKRHLRGKTAVFLMD